jgi:hypothetical protein
MVVYLYTFSGQRYDLSDSIQDSEMSGTMERVLKVRSTLIIVLLG